MGTRDGRCGADFENLTANSTRYLLISSAPCDVERKHLPFRSIFTRSVKLLRYVLGLEIAVLLVQDLQTPHLQLCECDELLLSTIVRPIVPSNILIKHVIACLLIPVLRSNKNWLNRD